MATASRPDRKAYEHAMRIPDESQVVQELVDVLGWKLTAAIGGVGETRAVKQWASGDRRVQSSETLDRLRHALYVASFIAQHETKSVAQAWFQGLNPQLGDQSAAMLLREGDAGDWRDVAAAARAFIVGG